ncbi:MAG: transcriptional repressor [Dehalococcoidia bacterium]|nr:transcriptional repressor [Dehalococcoidia bacterium]
MTTQAESSSERLSVGGHRVTAPRRAILDAIARAGGPFTIEELTSRVPAVGRATVFRTVKLLQESEVLCRVILEDGSVRYQLSRGGHHHHLICSECGTVTDFSDPELDRLIHENAGSAGFQLDAHSLELYGRCASCA